MNLGFTNMGYTEPLPEAPYLSALDLKYDGEKFLQRHIDGKLYQVKESTILAPDKIRAIRDYEYYTGYAVLPDEIPPEPGKPALATGALILGVLALAFFATR